MLLKRTKKLLTMMLVTLLSIVGLGNIVKVEAQEIDNGFQTTVNIHKIKTDSAAKPMKPEQLENGIADLTEWFGAEAEGLPGVVFEVYEVSQGELDKMMQNPSAYDTTDKMGDRSPVAITDATDKDGLTTVTLDEGHYWIIEQGLTTIASSVAVPFGLSLPYTNTSGTANLATINVYPKNTLEDTPTVEKTIDESDATQYIGQSFDWIVTNEIPEGIAEYTSYTFVDSIDEKLDYVGTTLISPTNLVLNTDYTVVHDEATNTLTLSFTEAGIDKLVPGEIIQINITTKINEKAIMGEPIKNDVDLNFENPHTVDKATNPKTPEVVTGGHQFKKTIDTTDGDGLRGAEFVILNAENQFIIQDEKTLEITFTNNVKEATRFVSTDNGTFEVKGLEFGNYVLREVKAPEGYALPTNPDTAFTVNENSYGETAEITTIVNKKITIPQTGGMGTMVFTVIGALLMTIAGIYYRKTSKV